MPSGGITDHLRDYESIWFKGLDFLYKHEDKSPNDPVGESSIVYDEAVKSTCHVVNSQTLESFETKSLKIDINAVKDIDRFGNYKNYDR